MDLSMNYEDDEKENSIIYNIFSSDNPLSIKIPFSSRSLFKNFNKRKPRVYVDSFSYTAYFKAQYLPETMVPVVPEADKTDVRKEYGPISYIILKCDESKNSDILDKNGNPTDILETMSAKVFPSMAQLPSTIFWEIDSASLTATAGMPVARYRTITSPSYYIATFENNPSNSEDGFELGNSFNDTITLRFYAHRMGWIVKDSFFMGLPVKSSLGPYGEAHKNVTFNYESENLYDFDSNKQSYTANFGNNVGQLVSSNITGNKYTLRLRIVF